MTPTLHAISGRLARSLVVGLLMTGASAPLYARDQLTLCFENKMVLPWRTPEGEGLNFEMLRRVESKAEVSFTYLILPWKRCLAKLKANEVDGAFTVSFSPERRQYGVFPGGEQADIKKRMHYASYFLVRKKGAPLDWDGKQLSHVTGKIAFQLGYSVGEQLRELNVAVDETSDTPYNVGRKILAGRVAGAAMMDSDAAVLMHGPLGAQLDLLNTPLVEKSYYLMLSNALVKSRPALADRVWKGIEEVRNGKEYGRLIEATGFEQAR